MKKVILVILAAVGLAGVIAARREVQQLEREASLWAEATDPVE